MLPSAPGSPNEHWPLGHTEKIDNVSVLFADLQGYTTLSETYDDADIVRILDDIYHLFDAHALRLGIEKIKTNGDEYMAAIGVPLTYLHTPEENTDQTVTMCLFAKALLRSFNSLVEKRNLGCNIRIGIATGSVTGGIIGAHKPHFDIWGKTVNRASRLEQASTPGTISVCARTRGQILDSKTDSLAFSESFVVGDNLVAHTLLMEPS
nr:adenylate/guanylate cyclase domain-containing protein [Alteromonas sp. C1M14]